jgi:hypothetical protein
LGGLKNPKGTSEVFLVMGPTGVGKTELARDRSVPFRLGQAHDQDRHDRIHGGT